MDAQSRSAKRVHFIGVAGHGMSALAQFHIMGGGIATGSDRTFDQQGAPELRDQLERLGIKIFPQDGSAFDEPYAYAVTSTALEAENAELVRAKSLGILVKHRADELAEHVRTHRSIAVAGTSGKSTAVAMIFEILEDAGRSPSIITGGDLIALKEKGLVGNAYRGSSDLLVVEADESDGTLTKYHPWLGVLLNISKDHKEPAEVLKMFATFRQNSGSLVVHGEQALAALQTGGLTFGLGDGASRVEKLQLRGNGSDFLIDEISFSLPAPGRHNVENALAAIAAARRCGVSLEECSRALKKFQGVSRRFERVGAARGIEVVDDYAHNPVKVMAAIEAAHLRSKRVLAVFQLHGYSPARFLRQDFVEAFSKVLRPDDTLWMPEIYYAGGTVTRDISARDISEAISARGKNALFSADRGSIVLDIARVARSGDIILVMGARDPSLPTFARELLNIISSNS